MDSGCPIELEYDIVPIAYRTHAHNIIRVISGYALKNSEWIELGRMSPKQPQV
jgi:peptidylglycine monooxygenase